MPKPILTRDQLKLLKYDNVLSGKYKSNFEIGIPSVRYFNDEVKKYCYMWREGGQFSTERYKYNEDLFNKWLGLKYKWQTKSNKNLALDNGIPRDKRIADWFFRLNGSIGIFVYRNPRIQYQQIVEVSKSQKLSFPSYEDFCLNLESQYQSLKSILGLNYKILFISFDSLLNDMSYRNKIELYFNDSGSPVLIKDQGDIDSIFVVMPMKG